MVMVRSNFSDLRKTRDGSRPQGSLAAYRARNELLSRMGYASYKQYLASDVWKSIREKVLSGRDTCSLCRIAKPYTGHHEYYTRENLSGQNTAGIIPICKKCHHEIEIRGGKKTSITEATKRAWKIIRRQAKNSKKRGKKRK